MGVTPFQRTAISLPMTINDALIPGHPHPAPLEERERSEGWYDDGGWIVESYQAHVKISAVLREFGRDLDKKRLCSPAS
jgi:hypothetical protein